MPIKQIVALILLSFGIQSFAQTEEDYFGTWAVLYGENRISEKISIPVEGVLRHYEFLEHYEFSFLRVGFSYQLAPRLSGTMGYAYLDSEPFVTDTEIAGARQHWVFEELNLNSDLGQFKISQRLRLENRWILKDQGTAMNHRMRYRLRFRYPIGKKLYAHAYNEVFVGLQKPLFNQNRMQLGLGYKVNPSIKLEAGYLKVHFVSKQCNSIRFAMLFKTDFRKNKNRFLASR